MTDKSRPVMLPRTGYPGAEYTHQGWLTEDHAHFLLDDEHDEHINQEGDASNHNTRTYVWDLSPSTPRRSPGYSDNTTPAIDHNEYVKGNFTY